MDGVAGDIVGYATGRSIGPCKEEYYIRCD